MPTIRSLSMQVKRHRLRIALEPALVLTLESSIDEANEYGEYFEFVLDGAGGSVNVNWGDGRESSYTLPMMGEHDYTMGTYTAVVTGDLNRITNLYGFSYGTIIYGIEGLTNLPALKTYNPSWGAVPINVDLSNCKKLETVHVEKYGAPYEPIDLRTDFKLPAEHLLKSSYSMCQALIRPGKISALPSLKYLSITFIITQCGARSMAVTSLSIRLMLHRRKRNGSWISFRMTTTGM
jgi:hypothetical protein